MALLMALFDVFLPVNLEALHLVFGFREACCYQLMSRNLMELVQDDNAFQVLKQSVVERLASEKPKGAGIATRVISSTGSPLLESGFFSSVVRQHCLLRPVSLRVQTLHPENRRDFLLGGATVLAYFHNRVFERESNANKNRSQYAGHNFVDAGDDDAFMYHHNLYMVPAPRRVMWFRPSVALDRWDSGVGAGTGGRSASSISANRGASAPASGFPLEFVIA